MRVRNTVRDVMFRAEGVSSVNPCLSAALSHPAHPAHPSVAQRAGGPKRVPAHRQTRSTKGRKTLSQWPWGWSRESSAHPSQ